MDTIKVERLKPRDYVGKDLRSPKYRMRVVGDKRKQSFKYPKKDLLIQIYQSE